MQIRVPWLRPNYEASVTNQIGRRGLLALIIRAAPGLTTLATNILIGRFGGTTLLGLTQSITSSASLAALIYPTPAGTAASRFVAAANVSQSEPKGNSIARYLASRCLLTALAIAIVVGYAQFLAHKESFQVAIVTFLVVIGLSLRALTEGLHFGGGNLSRLAVFNIIFAIAGLAATTLLLTIGIHDSRVIMPVACLNILLAAFSWPCRSKSPIPRARRREIRIFISLGAIGTIASTGFAQLTVLVNANVNGLAFTGQYAGAMTLTTPIALISSALSAVLFPALAAAHQSGDDAAIQTRIVATSKILATALIPILLFITLCSREIVLLVFGPDYESTSWILLLLAPSLIASAIASPAVSAITAKSNHGMAISATSSLIGLLVGVIAWFFLIPWNAEIAIPTGYVIGSTVNAVIPWILTWVRYKLIWFHETIFLLFALAIPSAIGYYIQLTNTDWQTGPILTIALTAIWLLIRRKDLNWLIKSIKSR